jgi:hypothetical protein
MIRHKPALGLRPAGQGSVFLSQQRVKFLRGEDAEASESALIAF